MTRLREFPFPLPPLAEQKRIVAKVEELLKLCEELQRKQERQEELRTAITRSVWADVTHASTPAARSTAWHRIANNFTTLTSVPRTIPELRQAILQLAVMGKLVEQDERDEPAEKLVAKIELSKNEILDKSKRKKLNGTGTLESKHSPAYELPKVWTWTSFESIATIASNLVQPNDYAKLPHVAPDNIEKATGRLLPYRTVEEDKVRSANHRFYAGQVLYSKIRPNLAKVTIVDFEGLCSADMYPINSHIDSNFLMIYMLSKTFLSMAVRNDTRVAMPKINQEELNQIIVPVPPLAEQKRIVAKVNQLLGLCDALETQLARCQTTGQRLLASLVAEVLGGKQAVE